MTNGTAAAVANAIVLSLLGMASSHPPTAHGLGAMASFEVGRSLDAVCGTDKTLLRQ
jgi:hypothetical protein